LWLNGPHPQIEDGVVTREVCGGSYWGGCCDYKTNPIRVKACPGNYYVYELVKPQIGCSGYCTDVSTISQVNNNGHLTFDGAWGSFSPYQFPAYGGKDLIAPFWTDIDNSWNGVISYQQYTSGSVLTQATQDINQYFPDLSFSASWVFVATWDRVAYYYNSGTETSFQVVLISNGHLSFVVINYGAIAPTQRYVQAGYDTIDSSHHFSITGSLQNDITSLPHSSNVNVPGRWAFRTDYGSRGCQFNGNVTALTASHICSLQPDYE
ncbi:hypothetical protein cypCar_00048845, partial [Cyprinus carpio]